MLSVACVAVRCLETPCRVGAVGAERLRLWAALRLLCRGRACARVHAARQRPRRKARGVKANDDMKPGCRDKRRTQGCMRERKAGVCSGKLDGSCPYRHRPPETGEGRKQRQQSAAGAPAPVSSTAQAMPSAASRAVRAAPMSAPKAPAGPMAAGEGEGVGCGRQALPRQTSWWWARSVASAAGGPRQHRRGGSRR